MSQLIQPNSRNKNSKTLTAENSLSGSDLKRKLSPRLKIAVSLAIAMTADALDLAFPVLSIPVDLAAAVALILIHGVRWEIFAVIAPEVFPATAPLPTWTLLVIYLATVKK